MSSPPLMTSQMTSRSSEKQNKKMKTGDLSTFLMVKKNILHYFLNIILYSALKSALLGVNTPEANM